jgi:apolipoprotein N-acyltransferase
MERKGVLDHTIPPAREATPYAKWGDATLFALLLIIGFATGLKLKN